MAKVEPATVIQVLRVSFLLTLFSCLDVSNTESPALERVPSCVLMVVTSSVVMFVLAYLAHSFLTEEVKWRITCHEIGQIIGLMIGFVLLMLLTVTLLGGSATRQLNQSVNLAVVLTFLSLSPLVEYVIRNRREGVYPPKYQCIFSIQVFDLLFGHNTDNLYDEENGGPLTIKNESLRRKYLEMRRRRNSLIQSLPSRSAKYFSTPIVAVHFYSVMFGCWLVTLSYKLDWMQPWQEYPVPSITAAIIASLLINSLHLAFRFVLLIQNWMNY